MKYNLNKDRTIKSWEIPVAEEQTAVVSLKSYDGGDPKLQIGVLEIKRDGKIAYARIKRWGWSELLKLREVLDEAIDKMDELAAPGGKA